MATGGNGESVFQRIGRETGDLVTEKNLAYGDSFAKTGAFLRLLYPNGIAPEQYDDALALVRDFDKSMRIATNKDAFGESPWRDKAGYAVLGAALSERKQADALATRPAGVQSGRDLHHALHDIDCTPTLPCWSGNNLVFRDGRTAYLEVNSGGANLTLPDRTVLVAPKDPGLDRHVWAETVAESWLASEIRAKAPKP